MFASSLTEDGPFRLFWMRKRHFRGGIRVREPFAFLTQITGLAGRGAGLIRGEVERLVKNWCANYFPRTRLRTIAIWPPCQTVCCTIPLSIVSYG